MVKQLEKLGLPFEILEAVQGSALTEEEILAFYDKDYYRGRPDYYTPGMVGCTLSHFFLYKKIVDEKIEVALVLEDDMVLNKALPQLLEMLSGEIRNDEVILLFYQSYFSINFSGPSALPLLGKYHLYQVAELKGLRSTGGYMINYEAAKSMVEKLLPLSTFPDEWKTFYDRNWLNGVRVVYPFLLHNSYEATTISPNIKGGSLVKNAVRIAEQNRIFPLYQLLKWRRKINIAKTRRCFIVNEPPADLRGN